MTGVLGSLARDEAGTVFLDTCAVSSAALTELLPDTHVVCQCFYNIYDIYHTADADATTATAAVADPFLSGHDRQVAAAGGYPSSSSTASSSWRGCSGSHGQQLMQQCTW